MPVHHEKKILSFTAIQMFDLVADIDAYDQFLPWCKASRVWKEEGVYVYADLIVGYKIFREKFTSKVKLDKKNKVIAVEYLSGPMKNLTNKWQFVDLQKGQCEIDFYVSFEFKSRVLQKLIDRFFDIAFKRMVNAFEKRAEEVYSQI